MAWVPFAYIPRSLLYRLRWLRWMRLWLWLWLRLRALGVILLDGCVGAHFGGGGLELGPLMGGICCGEGNFVQTYPS